MSWAEVKKINSDLSTPLDKLFKDSFYLYASDNTLQVILSGTSYASSATEKVLLERTMKYGGAVRIQGRIASNTTGYDGIKIYVNGTLVNSMSNGKFIEGENSSGGILTSVDISVMPGDVLRVTQGKGASNSNKYVREIYLRGTIGIGGGIFDE